MSESTTPRPGVPDPQRDRHVAYPADPAGEEGAVSGPVAEGEASTSHAAPATGETLAPAGRRLPPSAWAPAPGSGTPGPIRFPAPSPQPPPSSGRSSDVASKVVGAVVCGIIALALVANSGSGYDDPYGATGPDGAPVQVWQPGNDPVLDPSSLEPGQGTGDARVAWREEERVDPIAAGTPVGRVPAGTTSLRFEVATTLQSHTGLVTVISDKGINTSTDGSSLPGRGVIDVSNLPKYLRIDASSIDTTAQLQCQVWAGATLVALASGSGTVTCEPDLTGL